MNSQQISFYVNATALSAVIVSWFVFAGGILLNKRHSTSPDAKREPGSWIGLGCQGAGYAVVWTVQRRPFFSPLIDGQITLSTILSGVAIVLAIVSAWLVIAAFRELGTQWSLAARVIEGHKLVTTGPYNLVRHPIYTAMLGMLIATGVVLSHWIALIIAIVVFSIGTAIRTRLEEDLLSEAFGEKFVEWKRRVPSLIPFVKI